jgi:hypothetical protein
MARAVVTSNPERRAAFEPRTQSMIGRELPSKYSIATACLRSRSGLAVRVGFTGRVNAAVCPYARRSAHSQPATQPFAMRWGLPSSGGATR